MKRDTHPRNNKKTDRKIFIRQHVGSFDVLGSLASTSIILTFGKCLRSDLKEEKKELRPRFTALNYRTATKKVIRANPSFISSGSRVLKIVAV